MSGFVALPPAGSAQPATVPNSVAFDGWWPATDLALLRAEIRVPTDVTDHRLRAAAIDAMLSVAADLAPWRAAREDDGAVSLAAVESVAVGGETRLSALWRRAVTALAKADLSESARQPDTTRHGDEAAIERLETTIADHRRAARHAIRDILGVTRTTFELI